MRTCQKCGKSIFFRYKFCINCLDKHFKKIPREKKKLYKHTCKLQGRDITREKVRARDNWTCQTCGKKWKEGTRRFDVHHIDCKKEKSRKREDYQKEQHNMTTLCHKCHMNLPEHRKSMLKPYRNRA
jgi:hypothetical protein